MIVYGKQLILHLLTHRPSDIEVIFLSKECEPKLFSQMAKVTSKICRIDERKAQALSKGGNHQGFIAQIKDVQFSSFNELKKGSFLVVLEEITDVGNIGAIVRTAYAFGADGLILSGIKTCNLEAILRTSSGAAFELPMAICPSTKDMINELKQVGFSLYGADMHGQNVKEVVFAPKRALIMGSEGKGLSSKVKEKLDAIVSVKMARAFDSLNVSAATAILCDRIVNGS